MDNSRMAIHINRHLIKHCYPVKFIFIIGFSSLTLTACLVGPDFHTPVAPAAKTYTASTLPGKTAAATPTGNLGKAQYFVAGLDIPAQWWALFHSAPLNQLINTGLNNSPTLVAAKATLLQAQETLNAQVGSALFPAVAAQIGGQRQQSDPQTLGLPAASGGNLYNLYNASVSVTYALDIFGGARRGLEALQAQVDYQKYNLLAAYLTLTANIATTAVTFASLQEQIKTTQTLIQVQQDKSAIINKQFKLGGASQNDVLTQLNTAAVTQAALPPLEKSAAQMQHALAVLTGALPSEIKLPVITLDDFNLPDKLPVSLPSNLVRQRPDILSAEALLHAASAQVGVATANLLPQIKLSASYGWSATSPNNLFKEDTNIWNIGGQLIQPLFNAGSLIDQKRATIAAFDQAGAQYKQTVLQAFQNVADALKALENDARTLQAQQQATQADYHTLTLTQQQYRLGGVSYLSVLNARQQYLQARINLIQAQAARLTDTVALLQALGGGWWNNASTEPTQQKNRQIDT